VIRAFIVAASPLARSGLKSILAARGIEVCGAAERLDALGERAADAAADVVIIEVSRSERELMLEVLTWSAAAAEQKVIILTGGSPSEWRAQAWRAGIGAVLPADVSPDQLVAAIQAAANGLFVMLSPDAASLLAGRAAPVRRQEMPEPLTPRELEVLQMLASGLANKEIASRLSVSEHTVKFHVGSILGKLGAESRTEAVAIGIRRGLVLI